jgi:hypothetical protein
MRFSVVLPFALLLLALTSCVTVTPVTVDGHDVFGRVHDVSEADIRAAFAAVPRESTWANKTIYEIQVISSSEMHLFHQPVSENPSHDVMKRVGGKWHVVDTQVIVGWTRM